MVKLLYLCGKARGKTCMVEEPSHVKQLSLNHRCKIGLSTARRELWLNYSIKKHLSKKSNGKEDH
jgi:hypothetical protein